MAKYVRYALASVCFAASVGCLGLWWRSQTRWDAIFSPTYVIPGRPLWVDISNGYADIALGPEKESREFLFQWQHRTGTLNPDGPFAYRGKPLGYLTTRAKKVNFPLWYPALVFALAGVGVHRFRRQFSIRSALIAFAVVAALLAMPLTL
jgi:hypothetical protein